MTKWQDMFEIYRGVDFNNGRVVKPNTYYIVYKNSLSKELATKRGYAMEVDARRGAAMIFRSYMKSIEKELLGGK